MDPAGAAPSGIDRRLVRRACVVALVAGALWTLSNFLPALAWAVVLAIAVEPLAGRWRARTGNRHDGAIAAVVTVAFALLLLVPLALTLTGVATEAHQIQQMLGQLREHGMPPPEFLSQLPFHDAAITWWKDNLGTAEAARETLRGFEPDGWLTHGRHLGAAVMHRFMLLMFTALTLYLLLRHRSQVVQQLRTAAQRLVGPQAEHVGQQAVLAVRGTVVGLVLVGLGEGALMGVGYALFGAPHPTLLGLLTAVASMIPFGAAVAVVVAAAAAAVQGGVGAAAGIGVLGAVVIFIADHFVRPMAIGSSTRLPFLWILLGILGGVEHMGLIGLFVGPALLAVVHTLWEDLVHGGPDGVAVTRGGDGA